MMLLRALLAFLLFVPPVFAQTSQPAPYRLAPYKDELFAYQRVLESDLDGAYRVVEYDRPRDLYARDVERGTRVDPKYVSLETEAVESDLVFREGRLSVRHIAVGRREGAKAIVLFVHGRGANRHSGADDWIHGGNFNRIKNLMMRNDGLYLSTDFSNFGDKGTREVRALLLDYAKLSPGAPVFLACGSWGGRICWRLFRDPAIAPLLGGFILFDAATPESFIAEAARTPPERRIPIQISTSAEDRVMGWRSQRRFLSALKARVPDYPARLVHFSAGTHGLSLRMTDWRETVNWMLSVRDGEPS